MRLFVVRHKKTGDFVGPNRRMVTSLLAAGVWPMDRAVKIASVGPSTRGLAPKPVRVVIPLDVALRSDPSCATGSLALALADLASAGMGDDPAV